jgi:linoleoyl-CoA desaturase
MTSRYLPHGDFTRALNVRVDAHRRAHPVSRLRLWLKMALIFAWAVASWTVLVFVAATPWQAGLAAVSLGLAMAGIGFNVQHDGGHGAATGSRSLNRALAMGLDLLGGSSWVWRWKHNVFHHANPNAVHLDADIDVEPFVRLAPQQRRRPWHRWQHVYAWPLYALLTPKWQLMDDFVCVAQGRIGGNVFPRPRGLELVAFVAGKALFLTWAFAIPLTRHSPLEVLFGYLVASVVLSLALAITFQAAHCVEEADFPGADSPRVEWAAHQLATSVDFAPGNGVWSCLLGGLNYQTEHHLFPGIPHVELPGLAPVVRAVCAEHGVPYRVLPSFSAAIASHGRLLWRLGRDEAATGRARETTSGDTRCAT